MNLNTYLRITKIFWLASPQWSTCHWPWKRGDCRQANHPLSSAGQNQADDTEFTVIYLLTGPCAAGRAAIDATRRNLRVRVRVHFARAGRFAHPEVLFMLIQTELTAACDHFWHISPCKAHPPLFCSPISTVLIYDICGCYVAEMQQLLYLCMYDDDDDDAVFDRTLRRVEGSQGRSASFWPDATHPDRLTGTAALQ